MKPFPFGFIIRLMKSGLILLQMLFFSMGVFAHDLQSLDQIQNNLKKEYQTLRSKYPSTDVVLENIKNYSEKDLKQMLSEWKAFFKHYDDFNNAKIRFFTDDTREKLKSVLAKELPGLKKHKRKKLNEQFLKAEEFYKITFEKEKLFGGPLDYLRVVSFRDYFNQVGIIINEIIEAKDLEPSLKSDPEFLPYVKNGEEFLPVAPDFAKLLWQLNFRKKAATQGHPTIVLTLKEAQKTIANFHHTAFHWDGLENLQDNPYDGETIHLFFMNHANSYYDTTAQVNFPAPDISSIGNVNVIFPPFMANKLKQSNSLVTVGDGKEIEHIESFIKGKHLNRFMVATEGLTPVGFYEMRPMLTNVAPILGAVKDRGLKVKIYPMAFPDHLTLMNEWRAPLELPSNTARGVLHKAIEHENVFSLIEKTGDQDSICQFVRAIWFSDLKSNTEVFLGMPMPSEINRRMDQMFWADFI